MKSTTKAAIIALLVINAGLGLYNTNDLANFKSATEDTEDQIMEAIAVFEETVIVSIADLEWAASSCEEKVEILREMIDGESAARKSMDNDIIDWIDELYEMMDARIGELESAHEPIYDSGWQSIELGSALEFCTLEDRDVFVYMIGKDTLGRISHNEYGGDYLRGAFWYINGDNKLVVYRKSSGYNYEEVRVIVWKLS